MGSAFQFPLHTVAKFMDLPTGCSKGHRSPSLKPGANPFEDEPRTFRPAGRLPEEPCRPGDHERDHRDDHDEFNEGLSAFIRHPN